ncbi:MBL fold metallo-hydrolase [bacterium]|nr:MBL fold metallo-hydrolase [bacterium]
MKIEQIPVGPIQTNAFLVHEGGVAFLVDPGDEALRLTAMIRQLGVELKAILITHGHYDHIGGVAELREQFPDAELICHPDEVDAMTNPQANLSVFMGNSSVAGEPDRTVRDGDTLEIGPFHLEVMHIPGHTRGHVVFKLDNHLFAGDTLFAGGVGRWDLPGGDGVQLLKGLRSRLLALPDETNVYPGHGPATTIGTERATNPYLDPSFDPSMY